MCVHADLSAVCISSGAELRKGWGVSGFLSVNSCLGLGPMLSHENRAHPAIAHA